MTDLIQNIDWKLLQKQKLWLLSQECVESDGLLSLLDAIQDFAVDSGLASEKEVFEL